MIRTSHIALLIALSSAIQPATAQDWLNWRGPNYNGSTTATGLPVKFSQTDGVKWKADLPGPSAATPIIVGDRVFLTSCDFKNEALLAMCLDRKTGKILWRDDVGTGHLTGGQGSKLQLDDRSNYAAPSPVSDGKRVVFFFGNGDLAAYDLKGSRTWRRNLQKDDGDFAFQWSFSSSPQLYGGKLYMQILQRDMAVGPRGKAGAQSYLLCLDPATGKELWRSIRQTDAKNESRESYATPIPNEVAGRKELVIAGGDMLTGHDPATGKELWRWETYNPDHREVWWRLVPTPVIGGGVVLVCAPKRAPVYAAKLGQSGSLNTSGLAWKSDDRSAVTSDVPTPLFFKNRFYVLSDVKKSLSAVEPATGKILWTVPVPSNEMCWGSPTGADGKIYVISLKGEVFVFDPENGNLLATNEMATDEKEIRSSIAVAYGNLFIRTNTKLYCIGK